MKENKNVRPRGTDAAKVIQVIETISIKGNGTEDDPARAVKQYWSFDGAMIAENDPFICEVSGTLSQRFSHTE